MNGHNPYFTKNTTYLDVSNLVIALLIKCERSNIIFVNELKKIGSDRCKVELYIN